MLYIIGGAARAGKTRIARRMLVEHNIPCYSVDYFVSALDQGTPQLGIHAESITRSKAEKLWPILIPMLRNIVEVEAYYVVEGDSLWPKGVRSLIDAYPGCIQACFLGYPAATPGGKLTEIRSFSGGVNDWIQDYPDKYILDLCTEMIEWSQFLQGECSLYGIDYIDVSEDFSSGLENAYQLLYHPSK